MAVPSEQSTISYAGLGTTGPYTIPYSFLDVDDIAVSVAEAGVVTLLGPGDFATTRLGDGSGGSILTTAAYAVTATVTIYRDVPFTQPTVYPAAGPFPAESTETALDRGTMQVQQLREEIGRTPGITPPGITGPSGYIEASPDTTHGQDSGGGLVARTVTEELAHLGLSDVSGDAAAAQAAAAAAQAAAASIPDAAYPGVIEYNELRAMSGDSRASRTVVLTGGGVFWWTASTITDDGGIYLAATGGGTWVRQFDGDVNVRWYVADNTGLVDAQPAISAALATGRNVYIPAGIYLMNAGLEMITTGQKLRGDSLSTTVLNFNANVNGIEIQPHTHATVNPAAVTGAIPDANQFGSIEDLRIRYISGTPSTGAAVIVLPRTSGTTWNAEGCGIYRVGVDGFNIAFDIEYAAKFQCSNCIVKGAISIGYWWHGSPNNCPRFDTVSCSDTPIGMKLDAMAGGVLSLGDFATCDIGVNIIGSSVAITGGELESYEDTFFKIEGSSSVSLSGCRFHSRRVPVKLFGRSSVAMESCGWSVTGAYKQEFTGNASTVTAYAFSSVEFTDESQLTVYTRDTIGDDVWHILDPSQYTIAGVDYGGTIVTGIAALPATTKLLVTITQAIVEHDANTSSALLNNGDTFRYSSVSDFALQRTGRQKLSSGRIVTGSYIPVTADLTSPEVHPDNIGTLAIRDTDTDLMMITAGLDGLPLNKSALRQELFASTPGTGTQYLTGKEDYVRKDAGRTILPDPAGIGASYELAKQIIIRNISATLLTTIERQNGAHTINGVAANLNLAANQTATCITCGEDDDWTVLFHTT